MREIIHIIDTADDGRQIKRVVRSRMQISHRVFSDLKAREGLVLDGIPVHANHIVRAGQTITLILLDEHSSFAEPEEGEVHFVYRDQDLMVINKQAPLPCQSSAKQPGGTLENRLMHLFSDAPFVFRPVNRLDKGTSGLMVAAMHPHAQMLLSRQLHGDNFVRVYQAIVCGIPNPPSGTIDAPIAKVQDATVRREVCEDGRRAVTHYETLSQHGDLSLVQLRLETGRTHQIRVHMAHIGCPVFGDFLYGQEDERLPGRFALHSTHLEIDHPMTGEHMQFDAPLPTELSQLLED
ncbi:RluA family pseudouridine synthase [Eubacteriales bacterium OttesenSCG-928-N13]|nr:RluA family pseudouridine synthase [Eubacteriales bacterium OttesenSCG-928-N13]